MQLHNTKSLSITHITCKLVIPRILAQEHRNIVTHHYWLWITLL
jgi:hypothetical protein